MREELWKLVDVDFEFIGRKSERQEVAETPLDVAGRERRGQPVFEQQRAALADPEVVASES